jgi:hypothetical protein
MSWRNSSLPPLCQFCTTNLDEQRHKKWCPTLATDSPFVSCPHCNYYGTEAEHKEFCKQTGTACPFKEAD